MLKLEMDTLDGVDEGFRSLYEEAGGKFRLKVDGMPDVGALETKAKTAQSEAIAERKKRQAWEAIGKSPEEIAEMLAAAEKAETAKAEKAGEWDKLKAQMNEKHAAELEAERTAAQKMRGTLERYLVDAAATSAIASAKGVPELLLPHVQRHMRVVEEGGEFVAQVVDAKGDPRVNGKGEPLTVADLVAEMRQSEIYGRAFEGSGQSGSGMHPGNGAGGTGIAKKSDFKTDRDRAEWVDKHGLDAYRALPDG